MTDDQPSTLTDDQPSATTDGQPSTVAEPSYELLGDQSCGKKLPVNRIVRELTFARFITLAQTPVDVPASGGRLRANALTMPLSAIDLQLALESDEPDRPSILTVAEASLDARSVPLGSHDEHGNGHDLERFGEADGGEEREPVSPKTRGERLDVPVPSIAELIATRRITLPRAEADEAGAEAEVLLTQETISRLLTDGRASTALRAKDDFRMVVLDATNAQDAPEHAALPSQHEIADVAAFLAKPTVYTRSGRSVEVTLTPAEVKALLALEAAEVTVEGQEITLEPRAKATGAAGSEAEVVSSSSQPYGPLAGSSVEQPRLSSSAVLVEPAPTIGNLTLVPATLSLLTTTISIAPPVEKPKPPEVGFYIPYRQTWTLLGYSRGALLNTISLAPQEETTIELFTWDRRTNALEQTSASEVDQTIESTDTTKDTLQILNELERNSEFKANADARAKATIGVVEVGGGGGVSGGTGGKEVAKTTTDFIHEQTSKAVLRVKASRQSKVSETHEFGSEERTTRRIRNVNMCHPLHLDYFEVLVNYEMETVCLRQEAQLVVLLSPPEHYDWRSRATIRRFEPVLRAALLDRAFVPGFDASRLLAARECAFALVCERSSCGGDGGSESEVEDGEAFDEVREAAILVMYSFKSLVTQGYHSSSGAVLNAFEEVAPAAGVPQTPGPATAPRLHQWLFVRHFRNRAPGVWSALLSLTPTFPVDLTQPNDPAKVTPKMLKTLHQILNPKPPAADLTGLLAVDQMAAGALKAALRQVALDYYKNVRNNQKLDEFANVVQKVFLFDPVGGLIASVITDLVKQAAQKGITEMAAEIGIAALDARFGTSDLDDQSLVTYAAIFNDAYDAWQKESADLLKKAADTASALDTLAGQRDDQIRAAFPLSGVAEACEREEALMMHLEDNDSYYSFAVYQAQLAGDTARQPAVVSASGGFISSTPIGMVDGKLAFPVNFDAIGTDQQAIDNLRTWFDNEIRQNTALDDGPAPTVESLPTPGITLTSRLGSCSGCDEFITKTRELDLRHKTAQAEQEEHEAKRREYRLSHTPRLLDDPVDHDPAIAVRLLQESRGTAGEPPSSTAQPSQPGAPPTTPRP